MIKLGDSVLLFFYIIYLFLKSFNIDVELFLPSSAQTPASAVLSLALISISPHPNTHHTPRWESSETVNLALVGIPEATGWQESRLL
jgi:hypothetical protein